MIIAWTSGDKARERDPRLYLDQSFIMTYHTGSGGATAGAVSVIREIAKEWGIRDPVIAKAVREIADRVNRLINQ